VGHIIQKNKVTASGLCLWNLMTFLVLKRKMLMRTFSSFSVEIDATPTNLQLYFADFQRDSTVKEELCDSSLTDFNSKYVP
jgi:hypothetical protein